MKTQRNGLVGQGFYPVLRREFSKDELDLVYKRSEGWTEEDWCWPRGRMTRQFVGNQDSQACAAHSVYNALEPLVNHTGRLPEPEAIQARARQLDGLDDVASGRRTMLEAAAEAACELLAQRHGLHYRWVPLSMDAMPCWLRVMGPLAVEVYLREPYLKTPIGRQIRFCGEGWPRKMVHAITVLGHYKAKQDGVWFGKKRVFEVENSALANRAYWWAEIFKVDGIKGIGFVQV